MILTSIIKGKGKEYKYGILIFEGEFLNGKRNGEGKEYNFNGDIIFEGEYINGLRNGNGKEYEGEYKDEKEMEKGNHIIMENYMLQKILTYMK